MDRIEREKITIRQMIELYYRRKEKNPVLCDACKDLLAYAWKRLDSCRYGNKKCSCKKCPAHCYSPAYRAKIREVMRYSGPRMVLYHPLTAFWHSIKSFKK